MIRLPDSAQLQQLSAFDGDSAAAWRLQSALFAEIYGALASGLVLRPSKGAPRLVALTGADGAVRMDARDPYDSAGAALALTDRESAGLLAALAPARLALRADAAHSVLAQLLGSELALAVPVHAGGRSDHLLLLGCAADHALAQAPPALLQLLVDCLSAYLVGALDRRELEEATRKARVEIHDLADVQRLLVGLRLADVSGHGAGAAMEAVQFDAILRTYPGGEGAGPAGALTYANRHFFSRKARPHFLTALGFLHTPHLGEAQLCNAGHLPPLRRRAGRIERLDEGRDIPIGVLREHQYASHRYDARPGDLLVCYTDGITEARDRDGRQFGVERIEAILERNRLDSPEAILAEILAEVHAHQGGEIGSDDQTLVLLRLGGIA
ncbi:MAG: serine/threonine-protein phosphatase [Rhodanobacteraceae bacterium]|nr:serine/threonine-protein phosphatase [Rhodanobacteraceae bacterium]